MRKRDRRALARYIRDCLDVMELRDWEVELGADPADDGIAGQIRWANGRRFATLRVAEDFRGRPPAEQRETIAHELLHLHFSVSWTMVRDDLEDLIGRPADRTFWKSWERATEYGIEAMSLALAKHLPLIDWP